MPPSPPFLLLLLLLLPLRSFCQSSCHPSDRDLLSLAFRSVSGFQLPAPAPGDDPKCPKIRQIRLPDRNLSGTVSWVFLRNITGLQVLDLSGNALEGSIPGCLWSSPALLEVNLAANRLGGALRRETGPPGTARPPLKVLNVSDNRFTSAVGLHGFAGLQVLDLSRNHVGVVPVGLKALTGLKRLDVSRNSMAGDFPRDFPPLTGLSFLNVSFNNLTGVVKPMDVKKFGKSAFVKAGSLNFSSSPPATAAPPPSHAKKRKSKSREGALRLGVTIAAASLVGLPLLACVLYAILRKRWNRKGRKDGWKGEDPAAGASAVAAAVGKEAGWVAEAKWAAPVVVFEKPLMELTFADLAVATSGFGRESQLAEGGRSGPAFRAVLPGDMHVVVRVLEAAGEVDEQEAAAAFHDLARLRHPNLLPLLGYCIAGREKLLLFEYIEKGDLHRWLHELPAARPDVEDWSSDTWEIHQGEERRPLAAAPAEVGNWPTRHRIALGIARGLAFLHQGWAGSRQAVVHGHLVPTNILLGEDLEPRINDFGVAAGGEGTAVGDVHSYGVVLMELVTGRAGWSETEVGWARRLVREGRVAEAVDPRLRVWPEWEKEAAECLRVGYLCTAESPEKRPTMQQVVGLIKDVRPPAAATSSSSSSSH